MAALAEATAARISGAFVFFWAESGPTPSMFDNRHPLTLDFRLDRPQ
jgi:hypothetical protein